jgi:hypothetical protein
VRKGSKTAKPRAHDREHHIEPTARRLRADLCPSNEGSRTAPISIEADLSDSDEQVECKDPRLRCLVRPYRYRTFRAGLYRLFADIQPEATQLPFDIVIGAINKALPIEQQFVAVEAKQILKFMKDKLLDSLCADRVTRVDLEEIRLYA